MWVFVTLKHTFTRTKLWYECKVWEKRIVKGIEVLVLKGSCFEGVWCCLVHGRRMVQRIIER